MNAAWSGVRLVALVTSCLVGSAGSMARAVDLNSLESPVLFAGSETTAYRDPAVFRHQGTFHLFFTLVRVESDGLIYSYTATSQSADLKTWSAPRIITPKGQHLNYSSPGNVVRFGDQFVLCLQTYPRPDYRAGQSPRYGDDSARIYTMRSRDLQQWSEPEILLVKGPAVPVAEMGRMIDPFLIEDKDEPGKWWCFYKQNGASLSWSRDLRTWHYEGHFPSGENVCVWVEDGTYCLMHSPSNGLAIKKSADLKQWKDWGPLITLGQAQWHWAKGRLSAGAVLDLRRDATVGKYLLFFHGSGPRTERQGDFDKNASLAVAWSDDLLHWSWPQKRD
jgi:hypothetical protein